MLVMRKTSLAQAKANLSKIVYVWVAAREGAPLVTGDGEVLDRAALAGARAIAS